MRIGLRQLGVNLVGRMVASLHDRLRERTQLGACSDQPLHRLRIEHVVFRRHPGAGLARTGLYHRLIDPWHLVPLAKIDEKMRLSAALPPSGIVVVFRDLDETELLIVIGTDPFGGIDCALLERGKDVAGGKLLWHDPELGQDAAGKAADAELQPPHVVEALDLPAEPAAHLASRVAGRHAPTVIGLEEVVEQLHTAALELPGLLLASVESERQPCQNSNSCLYGPSRPCRSAPRQAPAGRVRSRLRRTLGS